MDQVSECFYRKYAIKIRQKKKHFKKKFLLQQLFVLRLYRFSYLQDYNYYTSNK